MRTAYQKWLLILAALFAMVWAVVRAGLQAVAQDEGDTYFWFAAKTAGTASGIPCRTIMS